MQKTLSVVRFGNHDLPRTLNPSCYGTPSSSTLMLDIWSSFARFNATDWCAVYALEAGMPPPLALRSVEEVSGFDELDLRESARASFRGIDPVYIVPTVSALTGDMTRSAILE